MITDSLHHQELGTGMNLQNLPRILLAPVPLFALQPFLNRIVRRIVERHPDLFARLGPHENKRFLINPVNMPFVLLLQPHSGSPSIRAFRSAENLAHDASISGTFLTLLEMVDGQLDGDSLFFTRNIIVDGDTEAVVCLRNALDDIEGSLNDDITSTFGPLRRPLKKALEVLKTIRNRR